MLKKLLIILVLGLLFSTSSNLSFVSAQGSRNISNTSILKTEYIYKAESSLYQRRVNERRVAAEMLKIYEAQNYFQSELQFYRFGSFEELFQYGLIDDTLASGIKHGYSFSMLRFGPGGHNPFPTFQVWANPTNYGPFGGIKSFYVDMNGFVKGADHGGYDADHNDPIVSSTIPYNSFQWGIDMSIGIQQIRLAQNAYVNEVGEYGDLNDLVSAGLINENHSNSWGAWLTIETTPATKTSKPKYKAWATPWYYRYTGVRSYFVDESGVLRAADLSGMPATESTPLLDLEGEEMIKYVLRTLKTAQHRYLGLPDVGDGEYATEFWQLRKADLTHFDIKNETIEGFRIEMEIFKDKQFPNEWSHFEITATPINSDVGNPRSFFISDQTILRGADKGGKPADENDPLVEF